MNNDHASFYRYWGKASRKEEIQGTHEEAQKASYHLLPYHCLDVAAVALKWWEKSASLRRSFCQQTGLNKQQTQSWLLFFIALHDYGKFDLRFQLKAPDVWRQLNPALSQAEYSLANKNIRDYWHGPAGLYWFYQDWKGRFSDDDSDDFFQSDEGNESWQAWLSWLAPVAGHHGSIAKDSDKESLTFNLLPSQVSDGLLRTVRNDRQQWLQALEHLFLKPASLSLGDDPPVLTDGTFLAGFCSVADWLGSSTEEGCFAYDNQLPEDLGDWFENRLPVAEPILERSGVLGGEIQRHPDIQELLEKNCSPRQVQCLVDKLPPTGGLTLIEASTGSGKTEAALAHAWRLLEQHQADSIIFALPTQATANAMLKRLEKLAPVIFEGTVNTVLAHGRARQEDFINLRQAAEPRTLQGDDEAQVQCARWLSESKKRVFLGQLGICTVDQVLVSVLPVRHKFVRGFGIGRSILIIDEVHAYDAYMYGLLEAVLVQQQAAGGSVILLSATLPEHQKQQLISAWAGRSDGVKHSEPATVAYPLITHVNSQKTQHLALDKNEQQPPVTQVGIELCTLPELLPDDVLLERMIIAAEAGAQVCLVCNLVDVAQSTLERLREKAGERLAGDQLILFHSRFVYGHRKIKEEKVLELFGPKSQRQRGHILVTTQVFECSIDADMDWMLTQLCPVDLLFQRWGRLHRHHRERPKGFESPLCTVLLPEEASYELHALIYGDSRILWRTQQLLATAKGVVEFPKAYRDWIETVYQHADWGSEPGWVLASHEKFEDHQLIQRNKARQFINIEFSVLKDTDANVAALTRDGEMSITVIPVVTGCDRKDCLLNDVIIDALDNSNRFEQISINSLGVPASWNRGKSRGLLPEMDDDGLIWLPMVLENEGYKGQWHNAEYCYHPETGLRRAIKEP